MSWIQTYTGKSFYPLDPRVHDVDIVDIAHALSMLCRFNGHCRVFYSVAEHSIKVSKMVPNEDALWGLLHDAHEAYLGDITRPVKEELMTKNRDSIAHIETKLTSCIAEAFGLPQDIPESVHEADNVLLATEAVDLLDANLKTWVEVPDPLPIRIQSTMFPGTAKDEFLGRFYELKALAGSH